MDFGPAKSGLAIEAPNGELHLIWEHDGTFKHRVRSRPGSRRPAPVNSSPTERSIIDDRPARQ